MSGPAGKGFAKNDTALTAVPAKDDAGVQTAGAPDALQSLQRTAGNAAVTSLLRESSGEPLDPTLRAEMEAKFGEDFGAVRVHRDEAAAVAALQAGARAVTVGHDIVFGKGFYTPPSAGGKRLIAHELAHVIQQTRQGGKNVSTEVAESEARQTGTNVAGGQTAAVQGSAPVGAQAEPMSEEEIQRLIAETDARAANANSQKELDTAFQQRNALSSQLSATHASRAAVTGSGAISASGDSAVGSAAEPDITGKQGQDAAKEAAAAESIRRSYGVDPHEFALKAGLGPISMEKLQTILTKNIPDPNKSKQDFTYSAPNVSQYSGPSISGTPENQRIVGRIINYSDPEGMGFIPKYERGTEAELEQRQYEANMAGNAQEFQRLQSLGAGLAGGVAQARAMRSNTTPPGDELQNVPRGPGTVKASELSKVKPSGSAGSAVNDVLPEFQNVPRGPGIVNPSALPKLKPPGGAGSAVNDVLPPNEPQSNAVPVVREQEQQGAIAAVVGQDFSTNVSGTTVDSSRDRSRPPAEQLNKGEGLNPNRSVRRVGGKQGIFRGTESRRANDAVMWRTYRDLGLTKDEQTRLHSDVHLENSDYDTIIEAAMALWPERAEGWARLLRERK